MSKYALAFAKLLLVPLAELHAADKQLAKPNIVIILADDLGYGDVRCNNPERSKIATPHIDRLAAQGMRFTDGHSSSGVCSPSRYALLTGRYHWRTRLQAGIVGYLDGPLIAKDRLTLPVSRSSTGTRWPASASGISVGNGTSPKIRSRCSLHRETVRKTRM